MLMFAFPVKLEATAMNPGVLVWLVQLAVGVIRRTWLYVQPVTLDVGAMLREPWQLRHVVLVLLGTLGHGKRLSPLSGANGVRQGDGTEKKVLASVLDALWDEPAPCLGPHMKLFVRSVPRDTMHRPVPPAASHALAAGSQKGRAASRVLGAL